MNTCNEQRDFVVAHIETKKKSVAYRTPHQDDLLRKTDPRGIYSLAETLKMFQKDSVTVCNAESRPSSSSSSSCNLEFGTKTTRCLADGTLALVGTGARHGAVFGQMVTICSLDVKGRRKAEILGHGVLWWLQCFLSVRVSHSPSGQRLRLPWFNRLKDPGKASWRGMWTHTHTQSVEACQG